MNFSAILSTVAHDLRAWVGHFRVFTDSRVLNPRPEVAGYLRVVALALALLVLPLTGCKTTEQSPTEVVDTNALGSPLPAIPAEPPPAPREFRGLWVATVNNIDWPSKRGLSAEEQRAEMLALLDRAKALNFNAVIFQVRPAADALYASELEPWSEYLTGEQGQNPGWDPLQEWVAAAHERGLELHAWFNPYRARHPEAKSQLVPMHVRIAHPEITRRYGDLLWMDPGEELAAERTLAVIRDVVRRYDVDGVHIDDYFYPYPITKPLPPGAPKDAKPEEIPFPDDASWQRYVAGGGTLERADWRRDNVNRLVQRIRDTVREEKPWVKFGISPFGLPRPDRRPAGVTGFSQYDKLYADAELWFEEGWCDYFTPQLYWPIDQKGQAYTVLLDYWAAQNKSGRHLWPGLFTSRIDNTEKSWSSAEILAQVALTRTRSGATGHVHFSAIALLQDRKAIATNLAALYATPALVPPSPWLKLAPPAAPKLAREGEALYVTAPEGAVQIALWLRNDLGWHFHVQPASHSALPAEAATADEIVAIAVNRAGLESSPTKLKR
jgi:uncharacterized lipoprotein YddW (UPF0748 family)